VSGYGWCGRGIALRAAGAGMKVIVCEVDPVKALEAHMDGYRVMPAVQAAAEADIWVTATGNIRVVGEAVFGNLKDKAILANAGHFNAEIDVDWLADNCVEKNELKALVDEYVLADGRSVILLAEGRLVNLAAAEGHPAEVMDMSFANQALASEYLVHEAKGLSKGVHQIPDEIDNQIARLKLASLGVGIDKLTVEQSEYLASWQSGTS
ncbi:MAG: adenosylhomocysteinase, partial [Coriobacteriia bacterium]|nr:adenosylhomocysteinase [Coriobacteriia bacterium]